MTTNVTTLDFLATAKETEANLRNDILAKWFPAAVDEAHGGFLQDFAEDWSLSPDTGRMIVYQARITWVAAKAAMRYPSEEIYRSATLHGAKFLRDAMWDHENGGFYWSLTTDFRPEDPKHVYGMAFAIYALVASYEATHDQESLKVAQHAFNWLESHAHDAVNGGYYEALDREGQPVLRVEDAPVSIAFPGQPGRDSISTEYGKKSMNTHIHLLEAFSELYKAWPDPVLKLRLEEVFHIVRDRIADPSGHLHMFFLPDWTVASDQDSYGHDIETAYLLVEGAEALGVPEDEATWRMARSLVDHTLAVGWDQEFGGIYDEGSPSSGPSTAHNYSKVWWAQAEGLNALLLMHEKYGHETPKYLEAFVREWDFIKAYQMDSVHGGWLKSVSREGKSPPDVDKSDAWTEAYHQGRSMMNVTDRLRNIGT